MSFEINLQKEEMHISPVNIAPFNLAVIILCLDPKRTKYKQLSNFASIMIITSYHDQWSRILMEWSFACVVALFSSPSRKVTILLREIDLVYFLFFAYPLPSAPHIQLTRKKNMPEGLLQRDFNGNLREERQKSGLGARLKILEILTERNMVPTLPSSKHISK